MITYRVDIDGIICTNTYGKYENAEPIYDNIEKINKLYDSGIEIILWTSRGIITGIDWKQLTETQLKKWHVKYHKLYLDKPYYDRIIDDRILSIEDIK